ncbi:MAG: DUF1922 domain-containing protein [Nitrososphaerota archaeon]|jgi:predicted RNA-binding Zn-ribbon protein involved in translation (DUF1610 family)|uniref:DUF1922 domain-containing protein n=1 Tax=Candidatus Bathycorpusculum sp. TaxID=2994959 RepID=UPI00282D3595|nr:DUF1922 domain-containing protein [Candidatus Termitimicrobium sp.]MCL2432262.1 DUF1922 domain-containing protein [Candidatus Termitimicrobium sp.]MDR0493101.1 DUF1922 domain-containing protein [Nitrososphaerota archaeon]
MAPTLIMKCTKCGGYMLSAKTQKTKICPYCGANINLQRAQRIASADSASEASEILRKLKSERGFDRKV